MSSAPILHVRTHLILGFLGVGKTTAIRHLLAHRPQDERWAVLVNEFGDVGVDGTLIQDGQCADSVAVKQIPGGCMCCASGPLTRVALNNLLRQQRPDRLLIEPSGLGHPRDIIRLLTSPAYQSVLQLGQNTVLLDPRHVIQSRYQSHPLFRDQLSVADRIVFNKTDLCTENELQGAMDWIDQQVSAAVPRHSVAQGELPVNWLLEPSGPLAGHRNGVGEGKDSNSGEAEDYIGLNDAVLDWHIETPLEPGQWVEQIGRAEGFHALSWRIAGDVLWQSSSLLSWLSGLEVVRLKAVLPTEQGWMMINLAEGTLSAQSMGSSEASPNSGVLEIIHDQPLDPGEWRSALAVHQV